MLAIKTKTMRDLVTEEPFTRKDIITIQVSPLRVGFADEWLTEEQQDPENLGARDLKNYDYIKSEKKVEGTSLLMSGFRQILIVYSITEADQALNPLKGINIDAAGGAGKVLRMVAEKVSLSIFRPIKCGPDGIVSTTVKASGSSGEGKTGRSASGRGNAKRGSCGGTQESQ
jgi:hypothetical protein